MKSPTRESLRAVLIVAGVGFVLFTALDLFIRREKATARRKVCARNLVQIGIACRVYAAAHGGAFPASFGGLLAGVPDEAAWRHPKMYDCPSSDTPAGEIDDVDDWTDYLLIPGLTTNAPARTPLGRCDPVHHSGDGAPVLFIDGTVRWLSRAGIDSLVPKAFIEKAQPAGGSG